MKTPQEICNNALLELAMRGWKNSIEPTDDTSIDLIEALMLGTGGSIGIDEQIHLDPSLRDDFVRACADVRSVLAMRAKLHQVVFDEDVISPKLSLCPADERCDDRSRDLLWLLSFNDHPDTSYNDVVEVLNAACVLNSDS